MNLALLSFTFQVLDKLMDSQLKTVTDFDQKSSKASLPFAEEVHLLMFFFPNTKTYLTFLFLLEIINDKDSKTTFNLYIMFGSIEVKLFL